MGDDTPPAPDVVALENAWRAALLAKDEAALHRLIHPDFELVGVRATGPMTVDLAGWLEALERMDIVAIEMNVVRQLVTPHVIVATVDACWKVRYIGHCIEENVFVTDVWVRGEGGAWQVIRRHSSIVPAKADLR